MAPHVILLPVQNDGFPLGLCYGHQDGDVDQFQCFTEPSTPKVKKFFRTIDASPQLTRVLEAVRQILVTDPDIRKTVRMYPKKIG